MWGWRVNGIISLHRHPGAGRGLDTWRQTQRERFRAAACRARLHHRKQNIRFNVSGSRTKSGMTWSSRRPIRSTRDRHPGAAQHRLARCWPKETAGAKTRGNACAVATHVAPVDTCPGSRLRGNDGCGCGVGENTVRRVKRSGPAAWCRSGYSGAIRRRRLLRTTGCG